MTITRLDERTKQIIRENELDLAKSLEVYLQAHLDELEGKRDNCLTYGSAIVQAVGLEKVEKNRSVLNANYMINFAIYMIDEHNIYVDASDNFPESLRKSLINLKDYIKTNLSSNG
jgi:hypothetical protein